LFKIGQEIYKNIKTMASIKLTDDLNSYLNKNTQGGGGGGGGLSTYFNRDYFVASKFNQNLGSWFGSQPSSGESSSSSTSSFTLSRFHRMVGFVVCLFIAAFCFGTAFLYLPFLLLKARKFSLLFSLGSIFTLAAFACLWGPAETMRHMFSKARLPFTFCYASTLSLTVYFAVFMQSTVLTVPCAIAQIFALVWYVLSNVPGGQKGLNFFTRICWKTASKTVGSTLPV